MGFKARLRLLFVVAAIAGCAGGDDGAVSGATPDAAGAALPDAEPGPTVEVSGMAEGFTPLVDGGRIDTYKGTQGGFHVMLAVRTTGLDPGTRGEASRLCTDAGTFTNPCVKIDVFDLDDPMPGGRQLDTFAALRLPLVAAEELPGAYQILPRRITLAITSLAQVDGHRFRIVAEVDDSQGKSARAEMTLTCAPVR